MSSPTSSSTASTSPPAPPLTQPISILFVCLGNICRSPMAEAVFRHLTAPSHPLIRLVDSAGTGAYHTGSSPDPRTTAVLRKNGIAGYRHAARMVTAADFERFDLILGMDAENVEDLLAARKRVARKRARNGAGEGEKGLARVMLFGDWGGRAGEEVLDPYYGADNGFDVAYEQMVRFGRGLLKAVESGAGNDAE